MSAGCFVQHRGVGLASGLSGCVNSHQGCILGVQPLWSHASEEQSSCPAALLPFLKIIHKPGTSPFRFAWEHVAGQHPGAQEQ